MARVTVRTLADALGVSVSTVSNASNRPDQLSTQLRARILSRPMNSAMRDPMRQPARYVVGVPRRLVCC